MSSHSNIERETVILYNQQEKTASICTEDPALIRKLDILSSNRPEITVRLRREGYGEYICPKGWIKVRAPRELSDEKKQLLAERMRRTNAKRKETENADN